VALALAGLTIVVALAAHPGIVCPSISRSKAIDSVTRNAKGYSASARLMTFYELQAGHPGIGHGSQPPGTLVWVVAVAGKIPNSSSGPLGGGPKLPVTWMVVVSDASTGSQMLREGSTVGPWPPYFNQLPDRAWFCPG
jgi:hypothetical protein